MKDATLDYGQEQNLVRRFTERRGLATVGAIGVMGGVLLWFMLVALLPWGAGQR